jgi:hypothetical protein
MQKIVIFWLALLYGLGGISIHVERAMAADTAMVEQADFWAALQWLEASPLAAWVNQTAIGYPTVLSLHVIGMAILVGTLLMLDLRLLNIVTGIPLPALITMIRFASIGFIINAISGVGLFVAQATTIVSSVPFLTKMTLIGMGAIITAVIYRRLKLNAGAWDDAAAPDALKKPAMLSIVFWVGAIIAGRLIAYLSD